MLRRAKFIKEGSFNETDGKPVLKVTGNIDLAEEVPVPEGNPDDTHPYIQKQLAELLKISPQDVYALVWYYKMKEAKKYHLEITTSKFKGLEADIIILIDIDNNMFDKNYEQILYVGASRARHRLYMIANLTDEECVMLLRKKDVMKARRPKKELASLINAKYKKT